MNDKQRALRESGENLRIRPDLRLCSQFDSVSIKKFPMADWEEMGVRVLDNFPEEHIM